MALAVVCAAAGGIGYAIHKTVRVKPEEMQTVNIATHQEGILRVGIISDTQLPPNKGLEEENGGKYKEYLKRALELLKTQNIDVLLHAGDIGDMCARYSYKTYKEVFESVFPMRTAGRMSCTSWAITIPGSIRTGTQPRPSKSFTRV